MKMTITCSDCNEVLEVTHIGHDVEGFHIFVNPCPSCTDKKAEPVPEKAYWQDLVALLEGTTVELKYYRKDGQFREFDCLLSHRVDDTKVYIFDQHAKTPKCLLLKNIAGIYDFENDVEYQVIGGLY